MKRLLALAILVVIGLMLFALPRGARGDEQRLEPVMNVWQKTPGRPNQWFKELGEFPSDIRLMVERNRGDVMYILLKRCAKDKQFISLAWYKGERVANGRGCDDRYLYSTDTASWEKRSGELPEALREKFKKQNSRK